MQAKTIQTLQHGQVSELYAAYRTIIETYENLNGGPWGCKGIPEYHAARLSAENCYLRIRQIEQACKSQQ